MTLEIGTRCDVCKGVPEIAYPMPEITGALEDGREVIVFKAGTWGICADCRPIFEAGDVEGLVARAAAAYSRQETPEVQAALTAVWRNLYTLLVRDRGRAVPLNSWPEWVT